MHRICKIVINSTGVRLYFRMQILSKKDIKFFSILLKQVPLEKQVSNEILRWHQFRAIRLDLNGSFVLCSYRFQSSSINTTSPNKAPKICFWIPNWSAPKFNQLVYTINSTSQIILSSMESFRTKIIATFCRIYCSKQTLPGLTWNLLHSNLIELGTINFSLLASNFVNK